MRQQPQWMNSLIGIGAVGGALTGILSFLLAVVSAITGNFSSAGICFIAAALAFGLLLKALVGGR